MSTPHPISLSLLAQLSRWALALIFIAAALPKIYAPDAFALNIANYALLPQVLINGVALFLPWLELIVAILLLCRVWSFSAFTLANTMLVIFLVALGSAYLRGLDVDCGCFGTTASATPNMHWYLARDLLFLALGLAAAWLNRHDPLT